MQNRVISALDILSLLSVGAESLEPFQKLRIFWKYDDFGSFLVLLCPFLTVLLSILVFAISLHWNFFCKFSGKKRK